MITRDHLTDQSRSTAIYSDCEKYRYALTRVWDDAAGRLTYIMLNPSKATERHNDPTVERCERRARALGYGGFCVTNIFAWRETDPMVMRQANDPIGPDNDTMIQNAVAWADHTLTAWGTHGRFLDRGTDVLALLKHAEKPLFHLGLTKDGLPRHPLYVSYAQPLVPWPSLHKLH